MPAAAIRALADQVVADLAVAGALSLAVVVARKYKPILTLEQLGTARYVTVVPRDDVGQLADRGGTWQHGYQLDLGVQTRVTDDTNATLDPLLDLVQEIADFYDEKAPTGRRERVVEKQHVPLFDQEHLSTKHCFTSVIRLTFRGWR